MNQTSYRNRSIRSPIQPRTYPSQQKRYDKSEEHPVRERVRKLCNTFQLTAAFEEDTAALSTLQTPGLIAVRCVLSKDGKPIGVGHGSSVVSRINRATERTLFSCFNGALMSAINSACKSLDVLRLEDADEQAESDKTAAYRETYGSHESGSDAATDKQKDYLRQLISLKVEDESEREQWMSQLDDLTKEDASEAIQRFAR